MGQAVVDLNLLPVCSILEVEEKERELNQCRTLAGLGSSDDMADVRKIISFTTPVDCAIIGLSEIFWER